MTQWNHDYVNLPQAWAAMPKLPGSDRIDWGDICVAHLDTGYTEHPVFGRWRPDGTNDIVLVDAGRNYLEPGQRPKDTLRGEGLIQTPGHGTRTSSCLAGFKSDDFPGGCAPEIPIVPYRVVEDVVLEPQFFGTHVWEKLAAALEHVVAERKCQIVSISLGRHPHVFAAAHSAVICSPAAKGAHRVHLRDAHRPAHNK